MHVAEQSPRICKDGTLRWYAGDTFLITFDFHLTDAAGQPIEIEETDVADVSFRNFRNEVLARYIATGSTSVEVEIDSETTKKFKEGVYMIDARFNGEYVTTIMRNNKVVVE